MNDEQNTKPEAATDPQGRLDALVRCLADGLASDIFHVGSERYGKINRLALKGGTWREQETDLGGLCEQALAGVIADSLRKRLGT